MVSSPYLTLRARILDKLGRQCPCGESDTRVLQIDHVYGDGADERRAYPNPVAYLTHIYNNLGSGRYQILCPTCNVRKRHERFETRRLRLEVIDDLTAWAAEYVEEDGELDPTAAERAGRD